MAFNEAVLLIAHHEAARTMSESETMVFPTVSAMSLTGVASWVPRGG